MNTQTFTQIGWIPMQKISMMMASVVLSVGMNTMLTIADQPDEVTDTVNQDTLSFSFGADMTSAYFFRGYLQENQGIIIQPWVEFGVSLKEGDGDSPDVSLIFGNWNSFQSEKTGSTKKNLRTWYESDFYVGVAMDWESFSLGISYTVYTYPSSTFNTVQELGVTAGFSLPENVMFSNLLGDISLGLHIEVNNSNVNTNESVYFELGFGPSFEIFDSSGATMSFPVTLGFSIDDYYVDASGKDDFFGYSSIGADIEFPLGSGSNGDWTMNIGGKLLFLGSAVEAANNGKDDEVLGYINLSVSY